MRLESKAMLTCFTLSSFEFLAPVVALFLLGSRNSIVLSMGCPLATYIKKWRRGGAGPLYGVP